MDVNQLLTDFCAGDTFWDTQLTWNTTHPELTRCFRQTALVWLPSAFLWLFAPLEAIWIARSRNLTIPWNILNVTRIVSVILICLLSLSDCIFCIIRYLHYDDQPSASEFSAPFITFATFLLLEVLINFHRWRGIHTSGVIWIFTLLALLSGFPTIHQYCFIRRPPYDYEFVSYLIYYTLAIIVFLLSCFADSSPKYILAATDAEPTDSTFADQVQLKCPEMEASFLSRLTFWWFNGMAISGYRKPLTSSDLWLLRKEDKTNTIAPQFDKNWLKQLSFTKQSETQNMVSYHNNEAKIETKIPKAKANPGVLKTLIKTFGLYFLSGAVFKLGHDMLQFVSPQLLKALIGFVSKPTSEEPVWHGYFVAAMFFVTACVQSVMLNYYFNVMFVIGMRVRTALISAIYRKSLNLSNSARKSTTTGEIVNLMSVDAQRFVDLLTFVNLVWSAPLQIFLAMFFLWQELGPSVLAGLAVMILMLPLNAFLATFQRKLQIKQMKQKDERVKTMNEILNGIRVIKLYAWEKSFIQNVFDIRNIELNNLKQMAYLSCASTFLWTCAPFLVALVTFAIYVLSDENNVLDAQKAFVSLALFNLLRFPMTMLPQMITFIVMTSVSLKRLNKFFNSSQLEKYVNRSEESDAITIEKGTFTWNANESDSTETKNEIPVANTLIDIDLKIAKGSFVAVVGTVGSGKSSLLSAILGDMDRVSGRVTVNASSKLAYVSQQAWIQNATLRNNILFGLKYDRRKYDQIINCCALKPDLSMLPGGDETEIGEKGINLSGGQKQRVAVARACYSDSDIILMDDPLSAVDSHVAKHMFEKVLSNNKGYLKDKTRLLVTNNLSILPEVDSIVVLKEGRVNEVGTYDQLISNKGDFADFIEEFSTNNSSKEGNGPVFDRQESVVSRKMSRSTSVEKEGETDKMKLIETEKTETGKVKFSIYVQYFRALTWFWMTILLIGMVGMTMASVGSNVWLAIWSNDRPINGTQDTELTHQRLGVYGLLGALQAFLVLLAAFAMAKGTVIASRTLHHRLLERILRSPMSFFDTTPLGRIVNRFSKDIDTVDSTIPHTIRGWLLCLLQVISTFLLIGYETPIFLAVILPIAFFYYFIQKFYVTTSRQLKRLESVTRSPIYTHFSETLSGVTTIRAYGSTRAFISESNSRVDYNQVCYFPSVCANRWLAIRLELCGNFITLFASVFAVFYREDFRQNPGFVGLIVTYALSVTQTLNWLVRMTSEMETNIVSVERITEYCENPTEAEWESDINHKPANDWPKSGAIEFVEYSVRYRPGLDLVLRDINTKIDPLEKIGIVGRTGAGKSSLTLALFRLLEAAGGRIVIDGIDISGIGLHDLRSKLTIIPQDPVLFSGTIRTNLDPFKIYTDDQIWTALEHSHLKHHIKGLDAELEHKVSEGGENLSVGQRQLICLARALLRKTKILVLDEATAAVDLETDSLIQTTIRKEFKDCTILTIAHRLNTILDSNRVLVLDKGQIGEFDSPQNLLQNSESIFHSLAKDARII